MWQSVALLSAVATAHGPDLDLGTPDPAASVDGSDLVLDNMEILGGDGIPSLVMPTTPIPEGIVNGDIDTANDFDNVVLLAWWDGSYNFLPFCSGSVIDDRWVVTAAHCLESVEDEEAYLSQFGFEFYVFFGSGVRGSYTDAIVVSDFEINPTYSPSQFINDIGLVELARDADVPKMVLNDEPIGNSWVGEELMFVGYGITSDGASDGGTKRSADIPVIDWDSFNVYSYEASQNVCQGDSGGATLEQTPDGFELAGINAFVSPGCVGGSNGSTRVDLFINWIQGFVPNALTEPDGSPPTDSDSDSDADTDADADADTNTDSDADLGQADQEGAWESPQRPDAGQYPRKLRCSTGSGLPTSGAVALALLLLGLRRRRT